MNYKQDPQISIEGELFNLSTMCFEVNSVNGILQARTLPMHTQAPPIQYNSFDEFYIYAVSKLKRDYPDYLRLDGKLQGASRKPFAYFFHRDELWKVEEDTWIEKLDAAYKLLLDNQDPFLIRRTKSKKNECLVIRGQPLKNKLFYVYLVNN